MNILLSIIGIYFVLNIILLILMYNTSIERLTIGKKIIAIIIVLTLGVGMMSYAHITSKEK